MSQALTKVEKMKAVAGKDSVQEQFENALGENKDLFVASLIDMYGSDNGLQKCEPGAVLREALKAATLKLPINRSLGFAWIVPYGGKPNFQIGYKGLVQLGQRTGQYKHIHTDKVFEGELISISKLTGEPDLTGEKEGDEVVGYFAHIALVSGFEKTVYWPKEKVHEHAQKFSKAYKFKDSAWKTDPDAMCMKTVLAYLISHYGPMSVDMAQIINSDNPYEPEGKEKSDAFLQPGRHDLNAETEIDSGDNDDHYAEEERKAIREEAGKALNPEKVDDSEIPT